MTRRHQLYQKCSNLLRAATKCDIFWSKYIELRAIMKSMSDADLNARVRDHKVDTSATYGELIERARV